jgi:hypothetical protein
MVETDAPRNIGMKPTSGRTHTRIAPMPPTRPSLAGARAKRRSMKALEEATPVTQRGGAPDTRLPPKEVPTMWRALFLAIGFFVMLLGVECLGVDKANLRIHETPTPVSPFDAETKAGAPMQIAVPPWAPWSLLSSGAVVCLYSFTLPQRAKGN